MQSNKTNRLTAVDEFRAVAVLAMLVAHFGPGVLERTPWNTAVENSIMLFSRLATVGFIFAFGIALGIAGASARDPRKLRQKAVNLKRRAAQVALCGIIFPLPYYINLALAGETRPIVYLRYSLSVLIFYAFAIYVFSHLLPLLRKKTYLVCASASLLLWFAATYGLNNWTKPNLNSAEYLVYHFLIGGPYGCLQLLAYTFYSIAVGHLIVAHRGRGERFLGIVTILLGAIQLSAGLLISLSDQLASVESVVSGQAKIPPRLWYWFVFGGASHCVLGGLLLIPRRSEYVQGITGAISRVGRSSLAIYTTHVFVFPTLLVLDNFFVIQGSLRIGLAAGVFTLLMYCVFHPPKLLTRIREQFTRTPAAN